MTTSFQELTLRVKLLVILQFLIVAFGFISNLYELRLIYNGTLGNPLIPDDLWSVIAEGLIILVVFHLVMIFVSVFFYRMRKGQGFGLLILVTLALDALIAYLFT